MDGGLEGVGNTRRGGLIDRAKAIILSPREEWTKIAAEPETAQEVFTHYAMPLAAIGPVAGLLGGQIFGLGVMGITYRPGLINAITTAIISYLLILVAILILSFIANALAPKFGGTPSRTNAMKLVVYGTTAFWLVGIFGLIPSLAFFGLLRLYSLYLYYTGATPMMKVPLDKAPGYTAVTILCAVVLMLIVAPITAAVTGLFGAGALSSVAASDSGAEVTLPNGNTINTGEVQKFGKQMEGIANGKVTPVQGARLQELLPASVGSYQRTSVETVGMGQMGSSAEAGYSAGDKSFRLKVVDMSALGALAGMGAAMGVEQSKEDANGYEKTGTVGGQMRSEAWNRATNSGKYAVVVANRFLIEADGQAGSVDELKQAVAAIDQGDLEDLAD
jgi:hypothetical protein